MDTQTPDGVAGWQGAWWADTPTITTGNETPTQEQVDALVAERDAYRTAANDANADAAEWQAQADALRAELQQVKAAHDANVKMHGEAQAYYAKMREAEAELQQVKDALYWLTRQVDQVERTSVIRESRIYQAARAALEGTDQ